MDATKRKAGWTSSRPHSFPKANLNVYTYTFKHALSQDAAYQSLLKSTRQQYHQRIAQMLETYFPEFAATQPEVLAHHCTSGGLLEQAVDYWHQAGQHALQRSAYVEAINHITRGLEVLKSLPETVARLRRELNLQMTIGPAVIALKGDAALEVEAIYSRARALSQQTGETPQLVVALHNLGTFYNIRGQFQAARELGEQALHLTHRVHDRAGHAYAHLLLGNTAWFLREFETARTHIEQGISLYNP